MMRREARVQVGSVTRNQTSCKSPGPSAKPGVTGPPRLPPLFCGAHTHINPRPPLQTHFPNSVSTVCLLCVDCVCSQQQRAEHRVWFQPQHIRMIKLHHLEDTQDFKWIFECLIELMNEMSPYLTCPWSITRMRSDCSTVLRRWAMVRVVQDWKASLMVLWISASVSPSMDAVASSRRMI